MSAKKQTPELIDVLAEYLNIEILDRDGFAQAVNEVFVNIITPRLYKYELERRGIISPKKASDETRGPSEVAR